MYCAPFRMDMLMQTTEILTNHALGHDRWGAKDDCPSFLWIIWWQPNIFAGCRDKFLWPRGELIWTVLKAWKPWWQLFIFKWQASRKTKARRKGKSKKRRKAKKRRKKIEHKNSKDAQGQPPAKSVLWNHLQSCVTDGNCSRKSRICTIALDDWEQPPRLSLKVNDLPKHCSASNAASSSCSD